LDTPQSQFGNMSQVSSITSRNLDTPTGSTKGYTSHGGRQMNEKTPDDEIKSLSPAAKAESEQ